MLVRTPSKLFPTYAERLEENYKNEICCDAKDQMLALTLSMQCIRRQILQ